MLDTTDAVARNRNWSLRKSIVVLFLVGIGGWCLLAGAIWLL